jgi:prolyl-tRNA synthetase
VHPVLELQDQQVQEIHLPLLQLKDLMEEYTHLEQMVELVVVEQLRQELLIIQVLLLL